MVICLFCFLFFIFLYTVQHERCCWWSRLWKKLQMENWTVQTSMPGIFILPNFRTVWSLYSHTKSSFVCMFMLMKFITICCDQTRLLGFAIRLVKSVLKCQATEFVFFFFWGGGGVFKWQKSCIQSCWSKNIKYLNANHSFPEWKAIKLNFFAP